MRNDESDVSLVVGGTSGLGLAIARNLAATGHRVVVTGRHPDRAAEAAALVGTGARGIALDLTRPQEIAAAVDVGSVRNLVLAAMERDGNTVRDYDPARAARLVQLKLVGYTELVHCLAPRFADDAAILLLGGVAMHRPQPGSVTVSSVNGAISALVRSLATELAPVRVNGLHPGVIADHPRWADRTEIIDGLCSRLPTGRPVTTGDVVDAAAFLLGNRSVNGTNLIVDAGESMA